MSMQPPQTMEPDRRPPGNFLHRHRGKLVWLAILGILILIQWPMIAGLFYRITGAAPPPDHIPWRTNFDAALAESKTTGKPVLLDFSASWCPPCQMMKRNAWPDPDVGKVVRSQYIPVAVDVDQPASVAVARRYDITSIPAIVIVDSTGRVLKQGAFMSASELVDFLGNKPG